MRHALALAALLIAASPVCAQSVEPRLLGGVTRVCTPQEIADARAGTYAGPPCRFSQNEMEAETPMPRPQPRPGLAISSSPQHAQSFQARSEYRRSEERVSARRERYVSTSSAPLRAYPPLSAPVSTARREALREPAPSGRPVRLGSGFGSGALAGGVGLRPQIYFIYGGVIIGADGYVAPAYRARPVMRHLPPPGYGHRGRRAFH